ncbi:MAG: Ig-like domain-containing protein [Spirochaetota bacterium]
MIKIPNKIKLILLCVMLCFLGCEFIPDTLEVVRWSPENHTRGVEKDIFFEMEFNAPLNKNDIEENFSMYGFSGSVEGKFIWVSAKIFRFVPVEEFSKNGRYVAEVPRSVRDRKGNTMGSDFISDFYIGDDFVSPLVEWSCPPFSEGAVSGISVKQNPLIVFSKSMDRESVEKNFRISPDVAGYYFWSSSAPGIENNMLTYVLINPMDYGKLYTLTLGGKAEDYAGNAIGAEYRVHFITGDDTILPLVEGIYDARELPAQYWETGSLNSGIDRRVKISLDFFKAMDRQSVEKAFSITPSVAGVFDWSCDRAVVFMPSAPLDPERVYQAKLDTGARDINGLKLAEPYVVEFKTDSSSSLFVTCSSIESSNNNETYFHLCNGAPAPQEWPLQIVLGDDAQVLWMRFKFVSGSNDAEMEPYSIFDNYLIETFKSALAQDAGNAEVEAIEWINPSTVQMKIKGIFKSNGHEPFLYRITLSGGAKGLRDIHGNYMKQDLVFEFREDCL